MSYFQNLVELRRKFYGDSEAPNLEKIVAASEPTRGVVARPTPVSRGTPKPVQPSYEGTESFMEFTARMKEYEMDARNRISSGSTPVVSDSSRRYAPEKEETLGVKQKPVSENSKFAETSTTPLTQEEQLKRITDTSRTVKVFMPSDVLGDEPFIREVERVAARFNVKPNDLLAVMHFETGGTFSPSIRNPKSTATGLIQFLDKTARGLGTTTDALSKMSRAEQMTYVENYLAQYEGKIRGKGVEELYLAVFNPSAIDKDSSHTLFSRGTRAYEVNAGLDTNNDGVITKGEAAAGAKQRAVGLMKRRT